MNAKFRIVTPAAASAVAVLLLTGCADKPIRVPGGTFAEEPYTGETTTKPHTVISNGEEITDTEVIFIDDEVPVGPVEDKSQAGQQDGGAAQGGDASAQQGGTTTLQPVEQDQQQVAKSNAPEGSVEYKVVKGDTLWGIGMVYGVSVARLAEINGIDEKTPLKIGQVLMIPPDAKNAVGKPVEKKTEKKQETKPATSTSTTKTDSAATTKTATKAQPVAKEGESLYVVKSGDNLSMIAYRHHVKLADLVAANKIDPKATLRVGQTLVIPAAGAKAATTSTTTTTKPATATTTKTEPASTTKPATAATTKTEPAATKPATATTTKGGEGTGGVVEPIGGSSMGGNSGSASASTSAPAATTKPATTTSASALDPVFSLSDADIISVQIDSESTLEEVANIHDRNLEDLIRLNPEFKSGQKIPAGTAVKMPLF